jgi:peptidoglycan hydrolase CwlO-like protein
MGKERDELIRKLQLAKDKLAEAETVLGNLEAIVAPLNKQIADVQRERKYLQMRIDKLSAILEKA